jgi:hypothetical protein
MDKSAATQLYRIVINASAQAIWDAITLPEWTEKYGYGGRVEYELKAGGRYSHRASVEMKAMGIPDEMIVGQVIESFFDTTAAYCRVVTSVMPPAAIPTRMVICRFG